LYAVIISTSAKYSFVVCFIVLAINVVIIEVCCCLDLLAIALLFYSDCGIVKAVLWDHCSVVAAALP
jgi:hypothetical protein